MRRVQHRRWASVGHWRWSSMSETLLVLWYRLRTYLAALRWTISSLCMAHLSNTILQAGSHKGFVCSGLDSMWSCYYITPYKAWFALPVILLMCLFQLRSELMVTPKYFVDFTLLRIWSCREGIAVNGWRFFSGHRESLTLAGVEFHQPFFFPCL